MLTIDDEQLKGPGIAIEDLSGMKQQVYKKWFSSIVLIERTSRKKTMVKENYLEKKIFRKFRFVLKILTKSLPS